MAAGRSPSISKSSKHNSIRKAVASNLSKCWNGSASKSAASPIPSPPAFFEQKENEREPNCSRHVKTRPSKGMESFMAPTISASSKITAASPRKEILTERNQVVQESTECSIVSAEEMKQEEEIRRKSEISIGSEETSGQNILLKLDFSGSKDHHQPLVTHSLDRGALDDDISLPPYDPVKNYLVPRPQFLYYKPNQKIGQQVLFYAGDERQLKDSFSVSDDSGNAADCSGTVEDDVTLMMTQEEVQLSLETHVSKPKPRSVGRSNLIPFLLILTVMSFWIPVIDSPLLTPFKTKDQTFVGPHTLQSFRILQDIHFYGYLDVANRNLQGLATRMRQWPKNHIETFSSFGSFIGPPTLLPFDILQNIHFNDIAGKNLQSLATRMRQWPKNYTETFSSFGSSDGPHTILPLSVFQDIHFYWYFDVANRNLQGLAPWMRKNFIEIFRSFGSFPIEPDMSSTLNKTISTSSMVQNTNLDFCFNSGFKLLGKKNVINEQDGVDSIKNEFQLDKTNRDAAERVIVEFSDGEALADDGDFIEKIKVVLSDEEDNFSLNEKRLVLFTDPVAKFETISKIEQLEKIEIAKFEELYGGVYPLGFNVEALVKEDIDSSAYPLVELQMTPMKYFGDVLLNFLTELQPFIPSGENLVLAVLGMFSAASMVYLFIKPKRKSRCKRTKLALGATNSCKHGANIGFNTYGELAELASYSWPTELSFSSKNSLHWREMRGHPAIPRPKIAQRREWRSRSARKGSKQEEVMAPVKRYSRIRNQILSS